MNYETLSAALSASILRAKTDHGLDVEITELVEGMAYDSHKRFTLDPTNKTMRNKWTKRWHISVTRFDNGLYEVVDYYA